MATVWKSEYFYGNKIGDYGLQEGYVDYKTLAKCFDAVLCNDILFETGYDYEQVSGFPDDYYDEIDKLRWEIEDLEQEETEIEDSLMELAEEARKTTRQDVWAKLQNEEQEFRARLRNIEDRLDECLTEIDDLEDEIVNYSPEIMQYYIVSDNAVDILELNNEIVYYIDKLGLYVWGVTHCGTSWDYVLTNIKIELEGD